MNKDDLRVVKTLDTIRTTFREMICEMDFEDITIKDFCDRARINRKTFYNHYESLDDLLTELQDEIVESFTSQSVSYESLSDIKNIIRFFYEYAAKMPVLNERLLCSGNYQHIGDKINRCIMEYRAETYRGSFHENPLIDNLVFAYFSANTTLLYRQWVADGKKLPLEDLIENATTLICDGMKSYIKERG